MADTIALRRSFDRARERSFAARFYEHLLAADREIAKRFARTDFERQSELLTHAIRSMLDYADDRAIGKLAVDRIAHLHEPGHLDIPPSMYRTWTSVFLQTMAETDPEFDKQLSADWKSVVDKTVSAMTSAHERAVAAKR